MIEIEAGPELQKAIEAIPVEAGVSITPEQEAGLRDWLYDFLVAFSALRQRQPRRGLLLARGRQ